MKELRILVVAAMVTILGLQELFLISVFGNIVIPLTVAAGLLVLSSSDYAMGKIVDELMEFVKD